MEAITNQPITYPADTNDHVEKPTVRTKNRAGAVAARVNTHPTNDLCDGLQKTAIDKPSKPSKHAKPCGRTTRSATREGKTVTTTPATETTRKLDVSGQRHPCAACHRIVSLNEQLIVCRFCGLFVHTNCDATLIQETIELLRSDSVIGCRVSA